MNMMKELRSRGPIIGDLEVPSSFSYYTSGIFSDDHAKALEALKGTKEAAEIIDDDNISENSLIDYNIQW